MTKRQIKLLKQIISEHMNIIMQITAGGGDGKSPSPEMLKKLGLPKDVTDLITDSYKYGKMSTVAGKNLEKMPEKDAQKLINDLKLTPAQRKSVEFAQVNAQTHLDSLQARITATTLSLAIQDQQNMYRTIKQVIPTAMANGTPRYKVIQQLREMSKDWERDWHRVAHTEMWNAKCTGEVQAMLDGESPLTSKGADTRVFKRPGPNACIMCKKLYLEKGTNKPKVFKLSELMANGTNYGLRQSDWKPVVGTVHPNCMCPLSVLPDGYHLNDAGTIEPD